MKQKGVKLVKTSLRYRILAVLVFALVLCLLLVVACKPNEQPAEKVKLTLNAGDGGSISVTEYELEVGTKIIDFLKDKSPTVEEGLTFGGWFNGENQIEENTVMPEGGLTLTAKYRATYTVNLYKQALDGTYGSPESITGNAWYHQAFTYSPATLEHYTIDDAHEGTKVSTQTLGKGDTFAVYYARKTYMVSYIPNLPAGESTDPIVEAQDGVYESVVKIADGNIYSISSCYRFAGWSTGRDGAVEYLPGEDISLTSDLFLFAIWDKAVTDIFGGSDYLFVDSSKQNTVWLRRYGIEDKNGVYNPDTGMFSFEESGKETLDGKILGEVFYYYRDSDARLYNAYGGGEDTLEFLERGKAIYTTATGAVSGTYDIDNTLGYYEFMADSGERFYFILRASGSAMYFQRQNLEEEGYYALNSNGSFNYPVLYLNGFGGADLHFDKSTYEYVDNNYNPILQYNGIYTLVDAELGVYRADLYYQTMMMRRFFFRLERGEASVPGAKVEFVGYYELNDGFTGDYISIKGDNKPLWLDGFGIGSYDGVDGTYELVNHTWYYLNFDNIGSAGSLEQLIGTYYVQYIVFTATATKTQTIFFIWDELDGYNDSYKSYYVVVDSSMMYGRYDLANNIVLEGTSSGLRQSGAFFYLYPQGPNSGYRPQLWIPAIYLDGGNTVVYMLYTTATEKTLLAGSEQNQYAFLYKVVDDLLDEVISEIRYDLTVVKYADVYNTGSVYFDGTALNVANGLTIDSRGVARYNGEIVEFTVTRQVVDIYTFDIPSGERKFVYIDGKFYELTSESNFSHYYEDSNRSTGYNGSLVLLNDRYAIVCLVAYDNNGKGQLYYAILGKYNLVAENEFEFVYINDDINGDETLLGIYGNFRFRISEKAGENVFEMYDEALTIAGVLTTDGYGRATYIEDGKTFTGSYGYLENLVLFTVDTTQELICLKYDATKGTVKKVKADEVGRYYLVSGEGIETSESYFLDGEGNVKYVLFTEETMGTYTRLSTSTVEGWTEYELTIGEQTFRMIAILSDNKNIARLGYCVVQVAEAVVDFDVVDDDGKVVGHLSSNGYSLGVYTLEGIKTDVSVIRCNFIDNDAYEMDYTANVNGMHVLAMLETGEELLFDIVKGNLYLRTMVYGTFMKNDSGAINGEKIYLDGHGKATHYNSAGDITQTGSYVMAPEIDKYSFRFVNSAGETQFIFSLTYSGSVYAYILYSSQEQGLFLSEKDWSLIILDGYGMGTYYDKYGVRGEGEYTFVEDWLLSFHPSDYSGKRYFEIDVNKKTIELFVDEYIIRGGVLYGYTGATKSIKIPDGVTRIASGAFEESEVEEIDFNKVTVIDDGAFTASWLTAVESNHIVSVGARAFWYCRDLTRAVLPAVKEIGKEAFFGTSLTFVKLAAIERIGDYAFSEFKSILSETLVFDFTEVPSVTAIELGENVFVAFYDNAFLEEGIAASILVNSIEDINTIRESDAWALMKDCVGFPIGDEAGSRYIDFASGTVYELKDGALRPTVTGQYTLTYGVPLGIYSVNEDGGLVLYTLGEDNRYGQGSLIGKEKLSVNGNLLLQVGIEHTFTECDLSLTVEAVYNVNTHVYDLTFAGVYGAQSFDDAWFDLSTKSLLILIDDTLYKAAIVENGATVTQFGMQKEVSGNGTADFYGWRATVVVDLNGNLISVRKLFIKNSSYTPIVEYTLMSVSQREGSLLIGAVYSEMKYYIMTLSADGQAELTLYGTQTTVISIDESCEITFISNTANNVLDILGFYLNGEAVNVNEIVKQSEGVYTFTFGGNTYQFTLRYASWYWSFNVEAI